MKTDMTRGGIIGIILRFTLPLFVGNVFQTLYNMADTIIVGRTVGEGALAAVGSTGTIMFLMQGFAVGLTTGFTVLTSQAFGAGDERRMRHSVANSCLLSLISAALITAVFLLVMNPLLHVMNTPDNIFADACTYISIIAWGLIACVAYNLGSALLRAVGNSRVPLYTLLFSAGLNVVLDLVCIINFHMGVAGAAVATDISQALSAIICFLYIYKKEKSLLPQRGEWKIYRKDTGVQMSVALPMALQFGITASGTMIMQSAINIFGSTAVAAITAGGKFQGMLSQGMQSMGQTMATFSGQNFGAGKFSRVRKSVRDALVIEILYSLISGVLAWFLTPATLGFFFSGDTDIASLVPWANAYVHLCVTCYIPLSMIFIFRNVMQGCGYGFLPMMGGVVEFFSRLLMAWLAMKTLNSTFAVACDPFAWLTAGIFTGVSYLFVMKDIRKKHGEGVPDEG
ncbi:MAG: MATE family efflux transporter [Lachnospiraceae bacterium]|jgi:putative MATE family efflux protein|nr:MATE family efflux transporter [Lachnospiraceae bacterium]MCH4031912.1 MATE family efflux transporter [Lachnospiraceae bacterium]MCH4070535.1 MATE family efflux transporter [Lachnospiraceae bacterium]MCH4109203.1 MATE family efflux transporter [Lachnospiraceae bacterium]MCI1332522.1 MATE family efflux transporter [Lachnospiraceae bacterium]